MEKIKLKKLRKSKQISQQEMADVLNMDVSNYNRREKGECKMLESEWQKIASFLNVPVEDIYEPDEKMVFICNDQSTGYLINGDNHVYTIPQSILDSQRKYIEKLEQEIEVLRNK